MLENNFSAEETNGQNKELLNEVISLLESSDLVTLEKIFSELHASDAISVLETLDKENRDTLLNKLPKEFFKENILWMSAELIEEIISTKGINFIIMLIKEVKDSDLSYLILKGLDGEDNASKDQILDAISVYERKIVEQKLDYPEDSAGRLMQSTFISILKDWNVAQSTAYIREIEKTYLKSLDTIYDVFIVDQQGVAVGSLLLSKLLISDPKENVFNLKSNNFKAIHTNIDQEDVALTFRSRGFLTAGIVDSAGVLVGTISIDDIIDVIYQETQEDLLLISGVNKSSTNKYKTIFYAAEGRLKWLSFNFIEALMIPLIVASFHEVLSKHVMLTAIIQFVVALGGNAGMQSLSVTLRGLTLKLISGSNVWRQVFKELSIAVINGSLLGTIGFLWGSFFGDGVIIGVITFMAVGINVILGTTFGTMFPIVLKKMKIDPAVASSICVTTSTDIVGFFLVLLIATSML